MINQEPILVVKDLKQHFKINRNFTVNQLMEFLLKLIREKLMDLLENQVLENQQQGEVLSVYINQLLEVLFLMEKIFQEKWIKKHYLI